MKTNNSTIVFLILVFLKIMVTQACQKERREDFNAAPESLVQEPLSNEEFNKRHEAAITHFLDNGHALKVYKLAQTKTGGEPVFEDRVLALDSIDYYFSSGLNYLYADASNTYSDYSRDSIISPLLEFPMATVSNYATSLACFNAIAAQVQAKKQSLTSGWNISTIMLSKEVASTGTLTIKVYLDLGYKDPSMGKALVNGMSSFPATACYKWNTGTCTNPTWANSGAQLRADFAAKVRTNYPQRGGLINYPNKKVYLTDSLNTTIQMKIFPYEYDTYTNPYSPVALSEPKIVPTELFSYVGIGNIGSDPAIFLNGAQLNYYLDKANDIIYDYRFGFKPYKHNAQWAKLTNQTELLDFVLFPNGGIPACPTGRRYFLNCCYSIMHEYRVKYCNYVIVKQPNPGAYSFYL